MRKFIVTVMVAALLGIFATPAVAATHHPHPSASCRAAIADGNALVIEMTSVFTLTGKFFGDLGTNAQTNSSDVTTFLHTLTTSVQAFTSDIQSHQSTVASAASDYHDAATKCLAGK